MSVMLSFLQQYFTGLATSLAIASVLYLIFWVLFGKRLGKRKIQLSKRAGWTQIKGEIGATALSLVGNTAFVMVVLLFKEKGLTRFYTDNGVLGWYELWSVVVMILVGDAWFYWCHRAMHHPRIYKYVHALHHKSLDVNPYTSTSFHLLEAIVLTVWILPLAMVMPISMTALGITQILGLINNLKSHLGYEFFPAFFSKVPPFTMLITSTNHSLHHTQYNGNYGLFFRFWDLLCKTELNTTTTLFEQIHSRRHERLIHNTTYRTLTVVDKVKETSNVVSLYLKPDTGDFYHYLAGQYLTIKVQVGGKTHHRCFSLSSSPGLDAYLRITVKLKGEVSHYFYDKVKVGDTIQSLLPVGDFTCKPDIGRANHYVMVAGGSGITPLYSMIKQLLHFEPYSKVTLLYASANAEEIIFKDALVRLQQQYPQFRYEEFISGISRISKEDLAVEGNPVYYLCGPASLKDGITGYLKSMEISAQRIHVEHFADGYVPWFGLLKHKN